MNNDYIAIENIKISKPLYDLVNQEIIPGTGINTNNFWASLGAIVKDLEPKNRELLNKRTE